MEAFYLSAAFLAILLGGIRYCSARRLALDWRPPLDSYETFHETLGRLQRPYLAHTGDDEKDEFEGILNLWVKADFAAPRLHWMASKFRNLAITLDKVEAAPGVVVSLSESREDWKHYGVGQEPLECHVTPRQDFILRVQGPVSEPSLVTLELTLATEEGDWPFAFLAKRLKVRRRLRFFIGPELGNTWFGFDPGTSGSCIAASDQSDAVYVERDAEANDRITPSLIVFGSYWEKDQTPSFEPGIIPESTYLVGARAQADFGLPNTASFQSFKRFLGFQEPITLSFGHGDLAFEGKDLSRILVRHVYQSFQQHLSQSHHGLERSEGSRRCVVAIPNTFTLAQAKAMRDVVQDLGVFNEVRCLTEAEAVFFYHLSRLREVKTDRPRTVMVFDMGGSTMNATIMRFAAHRTGGQQRYEVAILGRMGYAIGGDAIDYYLVRALCRALRADLGDRFRPFDPFLKSNEARDDLRSRWIKTALEIKLRHTAMMAKRERLSSNEALLDIIADRVFEGKLELMEAGEHFKRLFETSAPWPDHPLHSQPELLRGVFIPMDELVREVIQNVPDVSLDAIIYSGRSCRFPSITDRVRDALRKQRQSPTEILLPDRELKSAVARGCCWYGLNHAGIRVSAPTTSAAYGFRHTPELGQSFFRTVIPSGAPFQPLSGEDETDGVLGLYDLSPPDAFAFDNRQVVFYQLMGNAQNAFEPGQRHRVTPIISVPVRDHVTSASMVLRETDLSEHTLAFSHEPGITLRGNLKSLHLRDFSDEHFYWFLGRNRYEIN